MKLTTLNKDNEIIETITNEKFIVKCLISQLWAKTILKTKEIKRISYKYNYTDKQTIKFTFSNGIKYIFENIPTTGGYIDIDKILKGGE